MSNNREPTVSPHVDHAATSAILANLPKGDSWKVQEKPLDQLTGKKADPLKKSLAGFERRDLTRFIGTEFVEGDIQLSRLTEQQVEDLALLVAERGVVFFRKQDITEDQQKSLGRKLGPLHVHPLGFSDATKEEVQAFDFHANSKNVAGEGWHSDVSFEDNPSSHTILKITEVPPVGGDTVWVSGYAAYDRLTPRYKSFLEGLEAYHTNAHRHYAGLESFAKNEQGAYAVRRGPHVALHPVIRTHPLTNWKTLYVNQNFTTQIKGLSRVESDSVLQFLYGHAIDEEFKVRFRWEKDSVAIWDNMSISVAFTF